MILMMILLMILLKVPFAKDGSKLHECYTPDDVFDCALSVDGKRVVVAGKFGWNVFDFDKFPNQNCERKLYVKHCNCLH